MSEWTTGAPEGRGIYKAGQYAGVLESTAIAEAIVSLNNQDLKDLHAAFHSAAQGLDQREQLLIDIDHLVTDFKSESDRTVVDSVRHVVQLAHWYQEELKVRAGEQSPNRFGASSQPGVPPMQDFTTAFRIIGWAVKNVMNHVKPQSGVVRPPGRPVERVRVKEPPLAPPTDENEF